MVSLSIAPTFQNLRCIQIILSVFFILSYWSVSSLAQVKSEEELVPGLIPPETYDAREQRFNPTVADEILAYDKAQQNNTVLNNITDAFTSGANIGYQVYQSLRDNYDAGDADPDWTEDRKKAWIDAEVDIPVDQQWSYYATNNMQHAQNIYDTATENRRKAEELALRSGISPHLGIWLAHLIDVSIAIFLLALVVLSMRALRRTLRA